MPPLRATSCPPWAVWHVKVVGRSSLMPQPSVSTTTPTPIPSTVQDVTTDSGRVLALVSWCWWYMRVCWCDVHSFYRNVLASTAFTHVLV